MQENDNGPATKQDLNELRTELRGDLSELRHELRGDLNVLRAEFHADQAKLRDDMIEQMRDMQTEVLRAFHAWAAPLEIRMRALPLFDERLGLLEERVSRIERGEKHQ